jgi:hypothetical protein
MKTRSADMAEESQLARDVKELGSQVAQLQEIYKADKADRKSDKADRKAEMDALAVRMQEMIQENNRQLAQLFGIQSQSHQGNSQTAPAHGVNSGVGRGILGGNNGATNGGIDQGAMGGRMGQSSYTGGHSFQEGASFNDGIHTRSMKFDFPKFEGEEPETWCIRATQFFDHHGTPDQQRLSISAFHMEGRALIWFEELKASGALKSWGDFLQSLRIRFGKGSYDDPMEELTKLKQVGVLEDYKTQFDFLASKVIGLPDSHKLSMFLGGLKDEIRIPIRMFNPKTLIDAFALAKMQEETFLAHKKAIRAAWTPSSFQSSYHPSGQFSKSSNGGTARLIMPSSVKQVPYSGVTASQSGKGVVGRSPNQAVVQVQRLTQAQMDDRRRKGLCFNCDAKYSSGHVCTAPKLFVLEALEGGQEEISQETVQKDEDPGEFFLEEFLEISLNAIVGSPSPKTMRIIGFLRYHRVTVLIDSGSTHNFVDVELVSLLGLQLVQHKGVEVRVANGQLVPSPGKCQAVNLKLQDFSFSTEFFVLPLAGCQVVLGVKWLRTLGPILWDFEKLTMQFSFLNKTIQLQGMHQGPSLCLEEASSLKLSRVDSRGVWLQLVSTVVTNDVADSYQQSLIQELLQQFEDVFQEPKGLPPPRSHDHAIPLQEGVQPVSVRPYRYPFYQKEEIEKIVKDLLQIGVIRPSRSPFSSQYCW